MIDTTLTWSDIWEASLPAVPLEQSVFRGVMGSFPSGVTIVTTTDAHGRPVGLTSSAVTSVSSDPALVAVFVDLRSRSLGPLLHSQRFVINFLREESESLSNVFASKVADKFADFRWESTDSGLPELRSYSIATAECVEYKTEILGDHMMLVGQVVRGWIDPESRPLVYVRQQYGRVLSEPQAV